MTKRKPTQTTKSKSVRARTVTNTKPSSATKPKRQPIALDKRFRAKLEKSPNRGGWTYVVMTGSAEYFGSAGLVKVRGTIDGEAFQSSFMAMGDGRQMLPVKASVRQLIGKEAGDAVSVVLKERFF